MLGAETLGWAAGSGWAAGASGSSAVSSEPVEVADSGSKATQAAVNTQMHVANINNKKDVRLLLTKFSLSAALLTFV